MFSELRNGNFQTNLDRAGNGIVLLASSLANLFVKLLSAFGLIGLAVIDVFLGAFSVNEVFMPNLFTPTQGWILSLFLGSATFLIGVFMWELIAKSGKSAFDGQNIVLLIGVIFIFLFDTTLDAMAGFLLFSPASVAAAFSGYVSYSFYSVLVNVMLGVLIATLFILSAVGEPMFMMIAGWLKANVIGDIFVQMHSGSGGYRSNSRSVPAQTGTKYVPQNRPTYPASQPTNAANRPSAQPSIIRQPIRSEPTYQSLNEKDY